MENNQSHEKLLISIAIILCSAIICYNLFFIPNISIPTVVYVDKNTSNTQENSDIMEQEEEDPTIVNINTATSEELVEKLPRVGAKMAARIIEYRESNGGFKNIDELKNINGIGKKNFEKLKDLICI